MKKTIKLGVIGYGTVGQGVVALLGKNRHAIEQRVGAALRIAAVCDLKNVPREKHLHTKDYAAVVGRPDIDIVVELIGGYEPARTIILAALNAGKHVVTANKAVLAKYWDEVLSAARARGRLVYFEASVGGAIPVIQGLNEGLAANRIEKIAGILNGTTNFILSEMSRRNIGFKEALTLARKAGFAEADPSFDVDGIDTAHKLAILSSLAWSGWVRLSDIDVAGIGAVSGDDVAFARRFGYVIKLVGSAEMRREGLDISVGPRLVPLNHTFATVEREYNAVLIHGDAAGDVMFYGRGAGRMPAASAVVSDIIFLARHVTNETAGKSPYVTCDPAKKIRILPPERRVGAYYLRFTALDRPGVLAKISGILGAADVSIAAVYQEEPLKGMRRGVPIVMMTHHRTMRGNLTKALSLIDRQPFTRSKSVAFGIQG